MVRRPMASKRQLYIGIDTSCYTTSVACASSEGIVFEKRTMLSVPMGARGLRQSDACFQHIRNLPALTDAMFAAIHADALSAVAVSARPTDAADSYMPVFLAGRAAAAAIAGARGVPLLETSHQAGHVRAALIGNDALLAHGALLALHISGGTTDVLRVTLGDGQIAAIERIGGSEDLHAGQFVDRVGVRLGLPFPSGRALEVLARRAVKRDVKLPASVRGLCCSFSGPETQSVRLQAQGVPGEEIAYGVYDCLARTLSRLIRAAGEAAGEKMPVLLSGGVSGSALLRELLETRLRDPLYYAGDGLSSDNACGAAMLAADAAIRGRA